MSHETDILTRVRYAARKRILFLAHALQQMLRPDRMIRAREIRFVIEHGEVIEDYPADTRGHSCLMCGHAAGRPIHVVCAPRDEYLAIITAYLPNEEEWSADFRTRIRR